MHDAHAHVFPTVAGRTGSGPTRSLTLGRIRHGDREEQLLSVQNLDSRYPVEMLLANMDAAGIKRAMLQQGPFYGTTNAYQLAALDAFPDRLWGACRFDPWSDPPKVLLEAVASGRFRSLKLECSVPTGLAGLHPGITIDDLALDWIWGQLVAADMALTLDLGKPETASYQTGAVRVVAQRQPGLPIVVAHLCQPDADCLVPGLRRNLWQDQLALGELPNVWFDCAALPVYFPGEVFPPSSAIACMKEAFQLVGPSKILWGTDQPGVLETFSLGLLVELAHVYAEDLDGEGLYQFTEGNFEEVYGFRHGSRTRLGGM